MMGCQTRWRHDSCITRMLHTKTIFLIHWFLGVRGFEPSMSPLETLEGVSWFTKLLVLGTNFWNSSVNER